MRQRGEDPAHRPSLRLHAPPHDSDQRKVRLDLYVIGIHRLADAGQDILLLVGKLRLMNHHIQRVDPGGHMFKRNIILLKYLEHFSPKTDLRIHHILLNIDGSKPFLARDARDRILRLLAGIPDDPCPLILGLVRVSDIDGDPLLSHREYRILMKNTCPHVGKLPQLTIRDRIDPFWVLDNTRIRDQKSRHICPVLIHIRLDRLRHDRARNVGTAS